MRHDKLREERGKEHDAFWVGQVDEHRALKEFAAALRLRKDIQIERTRGSPLLNAEPDKISGARPFQDFKGQQRTGKKRTQANAHQHDMNAEPGL